MFLIPALEPKQPDIIDPNDFGPLQVNDLLVHEPLAHVNFVGLERNQGCFIQFVQQVDMVDVDAGHLVHRYMFLNVPGVFDPGHPGGVTFPANGQVPQFTHPAALVIVNGFSLELTEKEFP